MWRLIEVLREEESLTRGEVLGLLRGDAPPPMKRKYRDVQTNLLTILQQYLAGARSMQQSLRGIAYTFSY